MQKSTVFEVRQTVSRVRLNDWVLDPVTRKLSAIERKFDDRCCDFVAVLAVAELCEVPTYPDTRIELLVSLMEARMQLSKTQDVLVDDLLAYLLCIFGYTWSEIVPLPEAPKNILAPYFCEDSSLKMAA